MQQEDGGIPFLEAEHLKLLGHGRNNAIFSFKIKKYKRFVVRVPFFNSKVLLLSQEVEG